MTELQQIQKKAGELRLEFLLIGGLAVIEHGFARLTTDIDLLVRSCCRSAWKNCLEGLDYRIVNEKDNFQQFERPGVAGWPLDLMLVNDLTYDGLAAASLPVSVMGAAIRMVSLNHLLALKLHVLKQGKIRRFLDDFNDVVELVRANSWICNPRNFGLYFINTETMSFITKYDELSRPGDPGVLHDRLEFPEGHDFKPIVNRRKPEGFLDFCASYLPRLRQRPDYRQRRLERCCDAEFDLEHPERVPSAFPGGLLDELLRGVGS